MTFGHCRNLAQGLTRELGTKTDPRAKLFSKILLPRETGAPLSSDGARLLVRTLFWMQREDCGFCQNDGRQSVSAWSCVQAGWLCLMGSNLSPWDDKIGIFHLWVYRLGHCGSKSSSHLPIISRD